MRGLGRDANQRWLAFFIPGIVLVVVAMPVNGLARVLLTAVAVVFLVMAVIVGGRQRGTCPAGSLPRRLTKPRQRGKSMSAMRHCGLSLWYASRRYTLGTCVICSRAGVDFGLRRSCGR